MSKVKTPSEIVKNLDQYIVGQDDAKKAVAVSLYNRYRRSQVSGEMQQEITPKNLLMIGPTGVGKTEIARRLAKITNAPFVKVEATKFTEVGYIGRDVESMVRELVDVSISLEREAQFKNVRAEAAQAADKQLVKLIVPPERKQKQTNEFNENNFMDMLRKSMNAYQNDATPENEAEETGVTDDIRNKRLSVKEQLDQGLLDDQEVTITVDAPRRNGSMQNMMGQMGIDLSSSLDAMIPKQQVKRTMKVKDAREVLIKQESERLVDPEQINSKAIQRAENDGIIFIDEIDKITNNGKKQSGEVSREGVQRDILPIVEGSQISTQYGPVNTDHIFFIASGAFAESKPSDLIAELQGRFPLRVELKELTQEDFVKILMEPDNSLIRQYIALVDTDGVHLTFTKEAIERIAQIAYQVNHEDQNIGARRLATIIEKVLEEILFEGPDMQMGDVTITEQYVNDKVGKIAADKDLSRYIL